MLRGTFVFAVAFGMLPTCVSQEGFNHRYRAAPLMPILLTLDSAKLSGSLQLSANWDAGHNPDFPPFSVPKTYAGPAIPTLREILAVTPMVQVTEDRAGLVRMIDPSVPTDILNVRITHIEFRGNSTDGRGPIYNPDDGLAAILRTPEMVAFMKARGFDWPFRGGGITGNPFGHWPPQQPHMSGSLDNVTVSEALDHILETFPGIWVYENCPQSDHGKRDIYLGFFYLQKSGHDVFVAE